jgi:hypothetical protein
MLYKSKIEIQMMEQMPNIEQNPLLNAVFLAAEH